MQVRRELRLRTIGQTERLNQAERDGVAATAAGLGQLIVQPGSAIVEPRVTGNALFLTAGVHGGATLSRPFTSVVAAPGVTVQRLWTVNAPSGVVTIEGVTFEWSETGGNDAALVNVAAGTFVHFVNCIFLKPNPAPTTSFIAIAALGRAVFTACTFAPAKTTAGFVVNNAGAAADVGIVGCLNQTGQPHNNATVIFEAS